MNEYLAQVSAAARHAATRCNWPAVNACAREILAQDIDSPEGHFLEGLVRKAERRPDAAGSAFARALELDATRYDAAIELANQHCLEQRHAQAASIVADYEATLHSSPLYLHMAGSVYSRAGLPDRAWNLFCKADALQPGVDLFQSSLAACAVFLGRIDEARRIYMRLIKQRPTHQRYHYQLALLARAQDRKHIDEMRRILDATQLPADRNVFIYYAIGKELEDLGEWDEAFRWFEKAGDAVSSVLDYDFAAELELIDTVIASCDAAWLDEPRSDTRPGLQRRTPIFLVGLPRSGTTLTERIVSSHSRVASVGETQYMRMAIRNAGNIDSREKMTPAIIRAAAGGDMSAIAADYMRMLGFRLGGEPLFIDKMPFNVLYLGFIARAFPHARIIHMTRNPMDVCFAMYKQVFASAYKFSYSLESLGRFYIAYAKLIRHWQRILGERLVEVSYESLVSDQEAETRALLTRLDLDFEDACIDFEKNAAAVATASSVQVREKIHARSVNRWEQYQKQLAPLRSRLKQAGVEINPTP